MTVAELGRRMSSSEFTEWMAYAELEPFGEWRGDWRAGMIASTIANVNRSSDSEPMTPKDFMPDFEAAADAEPEISEEEQAEIIRKRFEFYRLLKGGKHIHRGQLVN